MSIHLSAGSIVVGEQPTFRPGSVGQDLSSAVSTDSVSSPA